MELGFFSFIVILTPNLEIPKICQFLKLFLFGYKNTQSWQHWLQTGFFVTNHRWKSHAANVFTCNGYELKSGKFHWVSKELYYLFSYRVLHLNQWPFQPVHNKIATLKCYVKNLNLKDFLKSCIRVWSTNNFLLLSRMWKCNGSIYFVWIYHQAR